MSVAARGGRAAVGQAVGYSGHVHDEAGLLADRIRCALLRGRWRSVGSESAGRLPAVRWRCYQCGALVPRRADDEICTTTFARLLGRQPHQTVSYSINAIKSIVIRFLD